MFMTCIHERNNALRCSTIWWHNNAALISSIGQQCEFNVGNCTKHWIAPRRQQHWFSCCFHLKSLWYFSTACCCWSIIRHGMYFLIPRSLSQSTVWYWHILYGWLGEKSNFPHALARLFRPQLKLQLPYVFRTPRVCSKVKRHYSKSYSCFMGVV